MLKKFYSKYFSVKENPEVSYHGNYKNWDDALADSIGYQDEKIFFKTVQSFKKIISGEFKCERDTILFDQYEYSLPLLLGLNFFQKKKKNFSLLDFGGSFASAYFRNFDVVKEFDLIWTVIEQPKIVRQARSMVGNFDQLCFLEESELNRLISENRYSVVLFGSCLQFLKNPKQTVAKLLHNDLQVVIIERTPILYGSSTKLTVQQVNKPIYDSSYPAWHFAESELMSWFSNDFDLRYKFNGPHILNECDGFESQLEDYVFTRKE